MTDPAERPAFEPEDLDGHTIDELTDYLEAGCEPADPSIDDSPACRIALAALQRLRDIAGEYLDDESDTTDIGQGWIDAVLAAIPVEARAGRRFPIEFDDPQVEARITEGAIRGLVRATGDEVPGLLVGAVRVEPDDPASLSVDVALVHGAVLTEASDRFRSALRDRLPDHMPFPIERIDIHVIGLLAPDSQPALEADR